MGIKNYKGDDGYGVFGQLYDASGNAVGSDFHVNTYTDHHQGGPSIVSLEDGGFLVTWVSSRQDGGVSGIYGQFYDSNGDKSGNEFLLKTHLTGYPGSHLVTNLSDDGSIVVVWPYESQDSNTKGIYGQLYDSSGTAFGEEFQVNTVNEIDNNYRSPSLASAKDGGFVVTWSSSIENYGLYGQRYDANGEPVEIPLIIDFNSTSSVD